MYVESRWVGRGTDNEGYGYADALVGRIGGQGHIRTNEIGVTFGRLGRPDGLNSFCSRMYLNSLSVCSSLTEKLFEKGEGRLIQLGIRQQLILEHSERLSRKVIVIQTPSFHTRLHTTRILCCLRAWPVIAVQLEV